MSKKIENIDTLKFIKLKFPRLIPEELIEAVKGRTFTSEEFYFYQENQAHNQQNFLYALVDESNKIQGYLWAEVNALDGSLFINTFSISKEYWGKGEAITKAVEFAKELKAKTKAPRTFWITSNEKFFAKHGFRKSRNVLMEYKEPEES